MPAAVAIPKTEHDVRELIRFAKRHGIGLIPRTAGTSLAGQVVWNGIVVDVGRHLDRILAIDAAGGRVRVQPGVVRNELNMALETHGLLFGPETSTANRAMMGGMVGNNSCGSNSLVYGSTRGHLISVRACSATAARRRSGHSPVRRSRRNAKLRTRWKPVSIRSSEACSSIRPTARPSARVTHEPR